MNILFLTTHLNTGGITSYLALLCRGLKRQGHEVFLVSAGGELEKDFSAMGVHTKSMNIRTKSELNPRIYIAAWRLRDYVEKNNIDIIHAHTRITQVMGRLLGSWSGRRYVSTCHGYFKNRLVRRLIPCWGEGVIAISEAVADHLEKDFFVPRDRFVTIRNGIDLAQFPLIGEEARAACRQKYNIDGGAVIGIIARLSDIKGHDVLIWSMSHVVRTFPDVKLVIVGQGKEEERLRQMTKELNLEKHVIFLPLTGRPTEILPLFDIFVLPSYKEGLALALIEAQASGLPVVASRVGGIPEIVMHEETGLLVEPGNIDALAHAILVLLRDLPRARAMGRRAHEVAVRSFSAERMVQETIHFYQEMLKVKSPA